MLIKLADRSTVVLTDANKDKLGNKITATTQNVTLTKDAVKPAATGHKVIKDNNGKVTAIELNFSEGLKAADEGKTVAPSIVNENGVSATTFLGSLTAKAVNAGDTKVVYNAADFSQVVW